MPQKVKIVFKLHCICFKHCLNSFSVYIIIYSMLVSSLLSYISFIEVSGRSSANGTQSVTRLQGREAEQVAQDVEFVIYRSFKFKSSIFVQAGFALYCIEFNYLGHAFLESAGQPPITCRYCYFHFRTYQTNYIMKMSEI